MRRRRAPALSGALPSARHSDKALKLVADLSTLKFEEKVAPHKATIW
jgi:hypothetical protein